MRIINKLNETFVTLDKEYEVISIDTYFPTEVTIRDDDGNEIILMEGEYEVVEERDNA